MTEHQSDENTSKIFTGTFKDENDEDAFDSSSDSSHTLLGPKDIYMRVAQNIELIQLYITVNNTILTNKPRQSNLFRLTTNCLSQLKQVLSMIEIRTQFDHPWFPPGKFVSFWSFYDRYNSETENQEQATNVKKFFARYSSPIIPQTA